jgi:glutamate carboxypeptidase
MMALANQPPVATSANGYGCRVTIDLVRTMPPWNHNEATRRLFDIWREAGSAIGIEVLPEARGGLSDGNYLWSRLPTLDGLGASGNNAHCSERSPDGSKDQEYASRSSFVPKATLNTLALLRLIG